MENCGLILMATGIIGGNVAGIVSDKLFQSRRRPSAGFSSSFQCHRFLADEYLASQARWKLKPVLPVKKSSCQSSAIRGIINQGLKS